MEDERIIDLYWQRSQEAISRTDEKYGRLCTKISLNILSNAQDAEECVSDTYMALWNSIPPQRPTCFQAFAAAIVRNLSLMKLREQYARKRGGGEFDLVLDELKDTIASCDSVEAECERKEFAAAVNQFLCTLSADDRNTVILRATILIRIFIRGSNPRRVTTSSRTSVVRDDFLLIMTSLFILYVPSRR